MLELQGFFEDADFWSWEARETADLGLHLEGWIPFRRAGSHKTGFFERTLPMALARGRGVVRITGKRPHYKIEVGKWQDDAGITPTCDQVHEIVQTTILPAIGARFVTGTSKR